MNIWMLEKSLMKQHYLKKKNFVEEIPALKKTKVKLDLLTDINMLLMGKKGTRRGICHAIHPYAKANNECVKDYDKHKESLYLKY